MAKKITRAAYTGVNPKTLAAASRRKIAKARALLAEVSAAWDENFQGVTFDVELILEKIDDLEPAIVEGVAYLNEEPGFDG